MDLAIAWLILLVGLGFPLIWGNPDAKRLYDDLLSNYNRLIRPVGNNSDRLTVKMGLRLSQLIDVVRSSFIALNAQPGITFDFSRFVALKRNGFY